METLSIFCFRGSTIKIDYILFELARDESARAADRSGVPHWGGQSAPQNGSSFLRFKWTKKTPGARWQRATESISWGN
ncbi:MAG: hypothetical protein PF508_13265 [Spirochaeta sp.]|nr:hypothetical protein [Spirochaeta sp.]